MSILRFGLDWTGQALFQPLEERSLREALVKGLAANFEALASRARAGDRGATLRGEVERSAVDPGDPRTAGWTWLVNANDPRREMYARVLRDLAIHRGMTEPQTPLLYAGEEADEWLTDRYFALDLEGKRVPQFVLIAGGPEQVPFSFQSVLHTVANVGRVDLDEHPLEVYVTKLIRLETAADPAVERTAILFASDEGVSDPTHFSRKYMVEPIGECIRHDLGLATQELLGPAATKPALVNALASSRPALVYAASHGLGAFDQPDAVQQRYNGAICCQRPSGAPMTKGHLFSADDVPEGDRPFLEGAVFFQFACFGYGTPAESDFGHWIEDMPKRYTRSDFVAALPKRLLGHPRGPIAYIGHLDTAFLLGFVDPAAPPVAARWDARMMPFVHAVRQLLRVETPGLAMKAMSQKYSVCNSLLARTYDRQKRGRQEWVDSLEERFIDSWITRGDAQNYMIYGDPGARPRIPSRAETLGGG